MKLGVILPFVPGLITSGGFLRDYLGIVEEAGAESVWTVEHVVVADSYEPNYPYSSDGRMQGAPGTVPIPDPLELLAYAAAVTRTVRLGTCVVVAPLHSPAVLAKRAATVDVLSGGRLILGLGIGWQKEEYAAVGVPFDDRGNRLEECIEAMRALWSTSPASYRGRHVGFDRVHLTIAPARGAVPIVLGGNSDAAVRRAGRIADGWFPFTIGPVDFESGASALREAAVRAGRPEESVETSVWPGSCDPDRETDVAWVRRYVEAGVSRLVVRPRVTRADDLDKVRDQLHRYRDVVLDRL